MNNILNRFKSLPVWVGIGSVITIIFTTAGVQLSDLTSWNVVGEILLKIINNPFTLFSILGSIYAFLNNPTNKEGF